MPSPSCCFRGILIKSFTIFFPLLPSFFPFRSPPFILFHFSLALFVQFQLQLINKLWYVDCPNPKTLISIAWDVLWCTYMRRMNEIFGCRGSFTWGSSDGGIMIHCLLEDVFGWYYCELLLLRIFWWLYYVYTIVE